MLRHNSGHYRWLTIFVVFKTKRKVCHFRGFNKVILFALHLRLLYWLAKLDPFFTAAFLDCLQLHIPLDFIPRCQKSFVNAADSISSSIRNQYVKRLFFIRFVCIIRPTDQMNRQSIALYYTVLYFNERSCRCL